MTLKQRVLFDSPQSVGPSLAAGLLQVRAVELRPNNPFTWSSGWKSPIYCDNRLILAYPIIRKLVLEGFVSIVEGVFPGIDSISGAATGGIAHAAVLADHLGLGMSYVRSSAKGHGRQKRVEGKAIAGSKAILIEDTLSTGKSAYEAAEALVEEGVEVLAVCSIFSYDFDVMQDKARAAGIPAYRLLDYTTLIDVAVRTGYASSTDVEMLMAWRDNPEAYGASAL